MRGTAGAPEAPLECGASAPLCCAPRSAAQRDAGKRRHVVALQNVFWRSEMYFVMILYYLISAFIAGMLVWNFIREKEDREKMLLDLIVLIPFVLRIFRIR
jgi:hypothetical protein